MLLIVLLSNLVIRAANRFVVIWHLLLCKCLLIANLKHIANGREGMKKRILKDVFLCVAILILSIMILHGAAPALLAKEPIKFGFIGALSTPYGASNKATLEISIEEINKAGGIMGRPVELITEDWKREIPLAMAAYKKLVLKDKCLVVFTEGTEGGAACAQLGAQLYPSYPHLLFSMWNAHEGFTDLIDKEYNKYKFIFRVYPSSADVYNPNLGFVELFKNKIGTKKLAILTEEMGWAEVYRKGKPGAYPTIKEYFEKNGIKVVYEANTDIKEKMFLPILEKVAASGADTIYWLTGYTDTVTLTKQWAQSQAKDIDLVLQTGACSYAAFWKMTGGQALGVTTSWPEINIPFNATTKQFLDKLKARKAGFLASTYGAYDGPWIIKSAVEKAGGANNVESLIKAIEGGQFQHGFWIWAFDKRHEPKKGSPYHPMPWGQFQMDGRFVLVSPDNLVKITNPKDKYIHARDIRKK
jgi:branched-chain amino acid transport system substrate-binding protein